MRVGVIHDWKSNWYTGNKDFADFLQEDVRIRSHIYNKLSHAGLSDILIRKDAQRITIDIYTARPGIVIGKSGVEVDALRKDIHGMTSKAVHININEIKRPELDAKLVAQSIAEQLENRVSFRRAMKRSLASAIRSGAQGVKVMCGGRLGGAEMSRSESYSEGRVPLHTIRADIDYGFAEAKTTTGRIGVKVWINKGEIMPSGYESSAQQGDTRLGDQDQARRRGGRVEGLGESRQGGRGRGADREGLGPVRQRRPRRGSGQGRGARRPREQAPAEAVEQPRTDEQGVSAEGREQPAAQRPVRESGPVEGVPGEPGGPPGDEGAAVEETPAAVADAPDTTTQKQMHEDPTKLDQSGDESAEKQKASSKASSSKPSTTRKTTAKKAPATKKPATRRTTKKDDES
jgi:small subunit ribosomal protein S3